MNIRRRVPSSAAGRFPDSSSRATDAAPADDEERRAWQSVPPPRPPNLRERFLMSPAQRPPGPPEKNTPLPGLEPSSGRQEPPPSAGRRESLDSPQQRLRVLTRGPLLGGHVLPTAPQSGHTRSLSLVVQRRGPSECTTISSASIMLEVLTRPAKRISVLSRFQRRPVVVARTGPPRGIRPHVGPSIARSGWMTDVPAGKSRVRLPSPQRTRLSSWNE
mmetsp:Transcript_8947/g.21546  ORF Transcript_8947/g.21546 Transcript_8947/m.21546 type:complete len:218 (-) Transcript_8947:720-1373(-)